MKVVGILPTTLVKTEEYSKIVALLSCQTLPLEKLIIVFQGDLKAFGSIKAGLYLPAGFELKHLDVMGLTHAKNCAIDLLDNDYDFCFTYEDDVEYPADYNRRMIGKMEELSCALLCCVQDVKPSLFRRIKALLYVASHCYPLNDRRALVEAFQTPHDIQSRFLSGGLTVARGIVYRDFRYDENLSGYCLGEDMDFSYRVSKQYKTFVTSFIRCIHNSKGTSKFGYDSYFHSKMSCWHYFGRKNICRKPQSTWLFMFAIANLYLWMLIESVAIAFVKLRPSILASYFRGLWLIVFQHRYAPYIKNYDLSRIPL